MSAKEELAKLQAMRAELEAESLSLIEKQEQLEKTVLALEEKVYIEELKKEKAVIEDLKKRNKATKDAIAQLEAKKIELEGKLNQTLREPNTSVEKKGDIVDEVVEEALGFEVVSEEAEEDSVTVTAIDDGGLVENHEVVNKSPRKKEKKKKRFF